MNGRTGDPYARFADMPDEDIVGLANTENNVWRRNICCISTVILYVERQEAIF